MLPNPDEAIAPTGKTVSSPGVVARDPSERLFAATVDLVAKRGYRETSIDHIVAAAEVGPEVFDGLYEGKEDCFLAAFDRIVDESVAAVREAVSAEDAWAGEMTAGIGCLLDLIVADPRRARFALVEVQAAGPRAYARYEEAVDRAAPKLREGRAFNEEAAALSGALEEAILGGAIWIVYQRLVKGELGDADPLLVEAVRIALSPYLGDKEAKRVAAAALQDRARRK